MYVASITFGLTAEDRDQLRNLTLISSMSVGFTCTILNLSTAVLLPVITYMQAKISAAITARIN